MPSASPSDSSARQRLLPAPWAFRAPAGLRILDVRSADDLAPHADAWAELLTHSRAASPMLSYPQISAFLESLVTPPETWMCLFAYEGERLRAVFPLIAARAVRVLGRGILILKTPYDIMHTSGVDCLTADGDEALVDVFLDYLGKMPRNWPLLRMRELPEHSPSMVHLAAGGLRKRSVTQQTAAENFIAISGGTPDFRAAFSSNFRRQLKRGNRSLEKLAEPTFLLRENQRSVAENMRRFEDVEDAGWKGEEKSSVKSDAAAAAFFRTAAERFQRFGWMEWNFLETAGQPIAAHYAVRMGRTLFLLKIGYCDGYSDCSPGNLLLEKTIAHAIEAGDVDEINCVADCAWHRNWGMNRRLLHDLVILPRLPIVGGLICRVLNSQTARDFQTRRKSAPTTPPAPSVT